MIRTTRARSLRTVPGKLTFIRRGAEGISRDTRDQRRKGLRIASSTPPALSLSKVLNSRNSLPCALTPRTKTGMARGSRAQWRRSGFGLAAAENPLPRRIRHHNQYKGDPLGGLPQMTSIFGAVLRKAMERVCSIWRGTREETSQRVHVLPHDPVSNVRKKYEEAVPLLERDNDNAFSLVRLGHPNKAEHLTAERR